MPDGQNNEAMNGNTPVTKIDLQAAIRELKEYIDERTHDAETRLLRVIALEGRPPADPRSSS